MLSKFQKLSLVTGPLANKVKALRGNLDKLEAEVRGRNDESAVQALRATARVLEVSEKICAVLIAHTAFVKGMGAACKLAGNVDKPAATDFTSEMDTLVQDEELRRFVPLSLFETYLKLQVWRAVEDKSDSMLRATVSVQGIMEKGCCTEAVAALLQQTALSGIITEVVGGGGHFAAQKAQLQTILTPLVDQTFDLGSTTLKEELQLISDLLPDSVPKAEELCQRLKLIASGPAFHFRISKLGLKVLKDITSQAQSQRNLQVFERRWSQMLEDLQVLPDDDTWQQRRPQMVNVSESMQFLANAPKSFWSGKDGDSAGVPPR